MFVEYASLETVSCKRVASERRPEWRAVPAGSVAVVCALRARRPGRIAAGAGGQRVLGGAR